MGGLALHLQQQLSAWLTCGTDPACVHGCCTHTLWAAWYCAADSVNSLCCLMVSMTMLQQGSAGKGEMRVE